MKQRRQTKSCFK